MRGFSALRPVGLVAAMALALGFSSGAQAATTSTSFAVAATVLQTCIVTATPLVFGNYDPTSASPTDATTTVLVTCTAATAYNVGLSAGGGTGASVGTRKMSFLSNTLNYSLFRDAGRTSVWGDTVGSDTVAATSTGILATHTVFGRIPAQQSAPLGVYADSITVTVTY